MVICQFKLPFMPPSYQKSLKINYRQKKCYLNKDVAKFKKNTYLLTPMVSIPQDEKLYLIIRCCGKWINKNGTIFHKDIMNVEKLLVDTLFEKWGTDDSHIWMMVLIKEHSDINETHITLGVIDD